MPTFDTDHSRSLCDGIYSNRGSPNCLAMNTNNFWRTVLNQDDVDPRVSRNFNPNRQVRQRYAENPHPSQPSAVVQTHLPHLFLSQSNSLHSQVLGNPNWNYGIDFNYLPYPQTRLQATGARFPDQRAQSRVPSTSSVLGAHHATLNWDASAFTAAQAQHGHRLPMQPFRGTSHQQAQSDRNSRVDHGFPPHMVFQSFGERDVAETNLPPFFHSETVGGIVASNSEERPKVQENAQNSTAVTSNNERGVSVSREDGRIPVSRNSRNVIKGGRSHQCPHGSCDWIFKRKWDMKQHFKNVHEKRREHRCTIEIVEPATSSEPEKRRVCGALFAHKGTLTRHIDCVHKDFRQVLELAQK